MQRKDDIQPPSKNKPQEHMSLDDKIASLEEEFKRLDEPRKKILEELTLAKRVDSVAGSLSKKFNMDKQEIVKAYHGKESELIKAFNKTKPHKLSGLFVGEALVGAGGSMAMFSLESGSSGGYVFAGFSAVMATIALALKMKNKKEASRIKNKVLEFNNNPALPSPKSK